MSGDRQELDMPDFGSLDDFETPRKPAKAQAVPGPSNDRARKAIDQASSFPSREASIEGQLNMKGDEAILDRFRALSKSERYKYVAMLEILMDAYEKK